MSKPTEVLLDILTKPNCFSSKITFNLVANSFIWTCYKQMSQWDILAA